MRFPWQGLHVLEASAPSAGVCHRCALIAQVPATRSAAERWHRRDEGAPWHAPERGRSRAAAAQLRWDGGKHGADRLPRRRPIQPICVTRSTSSPANGYGCGGGPRLAQFRPGFLRPLVLQRKARYDGIHASTFPRYSAAGLSASEHRPLRRPPQGLSDRGARRRRRYVDVPARIGTGSPTSACTSSAGPSAPPRAGSVAVPTGSRRRSGSQGSPGFLRFLSGSSLRDVNAVTQINFSK